MNEGLIPRVIEALTTFFVDVGAYLRDHLELVVAVGALVWAVYQFRWSTGKVDVFDRMMQQFEKSKPYRTEINKSYPKLMLLAYQRLSSEPGLRERLADELALWQPLGSSYTAAHEVVSSELKLRSLLWSIGQVRDEEASVWLEDDSWRELDAAARNCVKYMNDFGTYYEEGVYPRHVVLGQLHQAIVVPSKALEPLIWSKAAEGKRWGRRILRLGIRAQDYNDCTRGQQVNSIMWKSSSSDVMLHPSLLIDERSRVRKWPLRRQRRQVGAPRNRFTLWFRTTLSKSGRALNLDYGGRRLRLHQASEESLVELLQSAQALAGVTGRELSVHERSRAGSALVRFALDAGWTLDAGGRGIVVVQGDLADVSAD